MKQERHKDHAGENFPVARLVGRKLRPQVMEFYCFARKCDDIADNPSLGTDEKLRLLRAQETDSPHLEKLLRAFLRDAAGYEYRTWQDLLGYCQLSAAPVGRFILELYGEDIDADELCAVLQIANHLQDMKYDALALDRIYLPRDMRDEYGIGKQALTGNNISS